MHLKSVSECEEAGDKKQAERKFGRRAELTPATVEKVRLKIAVEGSVKKV